MGADGDRIDDKPRVACDVDTRVLELGRTSFIPERDVGKLITRVSRVHFRIHQGEHEEDDDDQPMYRLEDLASNSTFVNGQKVGKGNVCGLQHDDIITIIKDENGGPLLQYRFVVLPGEEEEDDEHAMSEEGKSDEDDHQYQGSMMVLTNTASAILSSENQQQHQEGNWISRNAVSISAAVVLLGSALAANVIHF